MNAAGLDARSSLRAPVWAFLTLLLALMLAALPARASGGERGARTELGMLTVQGRHLVDPDGRVVVLRGCNLGNWFLIEPWMFGVRGGPNTPRDQHGFVGVLESRFGPEEAARLIEIHRANWITPRDADVVRSFGFNAVRLPFHYSLLEDDARPGELRPDAFRWLDHAVGLCAEAGLYVILDLHGTPGGQSDDAPTGRVGQNRLWTDPEAERRTAWLWSELARHYKDDPAVAAYDIINEPYGDFHTDHSRHLVRVVSSVYHAIRAVDPDRLIWLPGTLDGVGMYGDPRDRGWVNVGFTEHTYPGVFGGEPASIETHEGYFASTVDARRRLCESLGVPYFVGEFNPIFQRVGGPLATRAYFDRFAELGWAATLWSYRVASPGGGITPDTWALATNARPAELDLFHGSRDEIAAYFESASRAPLAVNEPLRGELTGSHPARLSLSARGPVERPDPTPAEPWTGTDVGGATPGSQTVRADGTISVVGSGADIFADHDGFRFVHREAPASFSLSCTLTDLDARQRHAKGGLMLRAGTDAGAPHVLLHLFPNGCLVLAHRAEPGGPTVERTLATLQPPVGLGIERVSGRVTVRYTDADGTWRDVPIEPAMTPHELSLVGFAVTSHAEGSFARADFGSVRFGGGPARRPAALSRARGASANLLANASFERPGDRGGAEGWNAWGDDLRRETGWTPTRDGDAILAYHHWESAGDDNCGVWQDVGGLEPGRRYRFTIDATSDAVPQGRAPFGSVELRLEAELEGRRLTLASRSYTHDQLLASPAWNELAVEAAAIGETMRVLVVTSPGDRDRRAGALKLDAARLEPAASPRRSSAQTLRVADQFGDHMVVQRDRPIPVFGTATPGAEVAVELAGSLATAVADDAGSWRAELPPLPAGGPHTARVTGAGRAGAIELRDVLVGDVWFASGQSNMEWPLADAGDGPGWIERARTLDAVRLFHTERDLAPTPLDEPRTGRWERPDDAAHWSALAFHFARQMHESTGVPVGIVQAAWGGSAIRSWLPLADEPLPPAWVTDDPLVRRERAERGAREFDAAFESWMGTPVPSREETDAWRSLPVPGVWEPTLGPVDGVVWVCRSFDLPADAAGSDATLRLGPIDDFDRAYVNGVLVGQTSREPPEPWLHPRVYRLPAGVLRPGPNHLAVQVLDTGGGGGLHGDLADVRLELAGRPPIPLAGAWRARVAREMPPGSFPRAALDPEPNFGVPSGMHNAMVAPWHRVPVRGVLWYQGESDTDHPRAYAASLRSLITSWRDAWGEPDAPFLLVQLPNFMPRVDQPAESAWAELRRSQAAALALPHTGMAVTIDIGDPADIHPRNKPEVVRRLTLLARRAVFGEDVIAAAPAPIAVERSGRDVVIRFDAPLELPGGFESLPSAFAVAGPDRRFVWASLSVLGDRVTLYHSAGSRIERVRYAWADNPAAPLFGPTGLPVAPFELSVPTNAP